MSTILAIIAIVGVILLALYVVGKREIRAQREAAPPPTVAEVSQPRLARQGVHQWPDRSGT